MTISILKNRGSGGLVTEKDFFTFRTKFFSLFLTKSCAFVSKDADRLRIVLWA